MRIVNSEEDDKTGGNDNVVMMITIAIVPIS
jgi:hypothetical protein